ncbi:uncharacterized protein LOC100175924 [Ciona intestinalis]
MSFEKSVIEEANKHLSALNNKVSNLEATVKEQAMQLILKDKAHQEEIENLVRKQEAEINNLKTWLDGTQAEIRRMKIREREQEMMISHLKHRCSVLDSATKYSSSLEGLLTCLMEADKLKKVNYEDMVKRQLSDASSFSASADIKHRGHLSNTQAKETSDGNLGNTEDDIWSSGEDRNYQYDLHSKMDDSGQLAVDESSISRLTAANSTRTNGGKFSISEDDFET